MSALLLIVLVGVAVVATVRSIRRGLSDRHTVEEHHRTLDTLAEITHRQDAEGKLAERPPRVGPTLAQPHIRIMPADGSPPTAADPPVRWSPAEPPSIGASPAGVPSPGPASAGDVAVPVSEPFGAPAPAASFAVPPAAPLPTEQAPPVEPVAPVEAVPPLSPLEPIPPVPPATPVIPVLPATPEAAPLPASSLQRDLPPLSAPIAPPPRAPSRPAPVPPEPAAPLVALTVGGGEVAPEPPAPRRRWRKWVIVGVSAAATILAAVSVTALVAGGTRSGGRRPPSPAVAAPVSPSPVVTTPPTTAPPIASAILIESNSQGARYSVEPSAASIDLVPTSPCWVQVRTRSASGPVIFQGTMRVGDHLPLPTTAPVWLRLGNPPGISIVVNGTPLHLVTASVAQPYNLELQPAS